MRLINRDFITRVNNIKHSKIDVIIGLNGTGKTYLLNQIHSNYIEDSLLINIDGLSTENQSRKTYGERDRGKNSYHYDDINIHKIDLSKYRIIDRGLSNGQQKFNNILECLEYYTCNKSILLLDEPDVNLDNKLIIRLLEVLSILKDKYTMHIIIVTHNPNTLEMLNIDIDNIYIKKDKHVIVNATEDSINAKYRDIIKEQYIENAINDIRSLSANNKLQGVLDRTLMKYTNNDFELLSQSIKSLTHYTRFYTSLFFDYVILFEGPTESEIIKFYMKDRKFINHNIMFSKERVLLYMCIYNELDIDVHIVLDRDAEVLNKSNPRHKWNSVLDVTCNKMFGRSIVFMNTNIEEEVKIDTKAQSMEYKDVVMAYQINNSIDIKNNIIGLIDRIVNNIVK